MHGDVNPFSIGLTTKPLYPHDNLHSSLKHLFGSPTTPIDKAGPATRNSEVKYSKTVSSSSSYKSSNNYQQNPSSDPQNQTAFILKNEDKKKKKIQAKLTRGNGGDEKVEEWAWKWAWVAAMGA